MAHAHQDTWRDPLSLGHVAMVRAAHDNGGHGVSTIGIRVAEVTGNIARLPLWRDGNNPTTPGGRQCLPVAFSF